MSRSFASGSSEYLQVDQAVVSGTPFTLACWFYATQDTASQAILSIADKDDNDYHTLFAAGSGAGDPIWANTWTGSAARIAQTTSGYTINTWHHACGVWAADNDRRAYIDGGSKGTNANAHTVANIDRFRVSSTANDDPKNYFDGRIAEVGVWEVALTDAEVLILAHGYSPLFVRPASLVAYWPLIRDEDQDRVGGYDLTPVNTPSIAAHCPVLYPG